MAESKNKPKGTAFSYEMSVERYPKGTKMVKRKDGTMYAKPPAKNNIKKK